MIKPRIATIALTLSAALGALSPASAEQPAQAQTTPSMIACPVPSIVTTLERVMTTLMYGTVEPCELTAATPSLPFVFGAN